METSLEIKGPTERALHVTVPPERFTDAVERRLHHLSRTVRMDGFRPGKVPVQIVRQRYLQNVYGEVTEQLAEESLREALQAKQIEPVSSPRVMVETSGEGRPFKYQASFEVYPELTEKQVRAIEILEPEVMVNDNDVADGVEQVRRQFGVGQSVDRGAQEGDQVVFRHASAGAEETLGEIDESAQPVELTLGPGSMVEELHEHLVGKRSGEEFEATVKFANAGDGAVTRFRIRLLEVRELQLPAVEDPRWLEQAGGPGTTPESFRQSVRSHLDYRCVEMRRGHLVQAITDALVEPKGSVLAVPVSLRADCLAHLRQEDDQLPADLPDDHPLNVEALETARRLTMSRALSRLSGLATDAEDLRRVEEAYASQFRDPVAGRHRARHDPQTRSGLMLAASWDTLTRWVLERAKVSKEPWTYGQLCQRVEGA